MVLSITTRLCVNSRGPLFPICVGATKGLAQEDDPGCMGEAELWMDETVGRGRLALEGSLGTTMRSSFSAMRNPLGGQRGLELILENGCKCVGIKGNALTPVEIVKGKRTVKCAEIQRYVTCVNLIIPELRAYKVSHIYREGNRAADKFAQLGHQSKEPRIRRTPPDEVLQIFHDDAQGKTVLRK